MAVSHVVVRLSDCRVSITSTDAITHTTQPLLNHTQFSQLSLSLRSVSRRRSRLHKCTPCRSIPSATPCWRQAKIERAQIVLEGHDHKRGIGLTLVRRPTVRLWKHNSSLHCIVYSRPFTMDNSELTLTDSLCNCVISGRQKNKGSRAATQRTRWYVCMATKETCSSRPTGWSKKVIPLF